jgi:hypothetical protein
LADKSSKSIGFKLIALISIAFGGYITFAMILMSRMYLKLSSTVGILTILAGLALMIAGLSALMSVKVGHYVYSGSCVIWLLRLLPMIFFKSPFLGEMPQPVSGIVVIVFGMTAIPFWLSLFGVILSYYEMKKLRRIELNEKRH